METFRRKEESKKTRERDFGLSKNHCSRHTVAPSRDQLDRVKKQFSFPWPPGSDCRRPRLPIAYVGFDKAIPIQSSFENGSWKTSGEAWRGRSTGSAPERAKNWTRCVGFQPNERTGVDAISKRRVKEIVTVSLVQLCCTELGCIIACTSLFLFFILEEDGDGEISISSNRKLIIWIFYLESVLAREISEREKIWIWWIIAMCGWWWILTDNFPFNNVQL